MFYFLTSSERSNYSGVKYHSIIYFRCTSLGPLSFINHSVTRSSFGLRDSPIPRFPDLSGLGFLSLGLPVMKALLKKKKFCNEFGSLFSNLQIKNRRWSKRRELINFRLNWKRVFRKSLTPKTVRISTQRRHLAFHGSTVLNELKILRHLFFFLFFQEWNYNTWSPEFINFLCTFCIFTAKKKATKPRFNFKASYAKGAFDIGINLHWPCRLLTFCSVSFFFWIAKNHFFF